MIIMAEVDMIRVVEATIQEDVIPVEGEIVEVVETETEAEVVIKILFRLSKQHMKV